MTAEWYEKMMKKKKLSNLDILAEAAAMVSEQNERAKKGKSKMTVSEEDEVEESEKRFFYIFPRKSRSWVTRRNPRTIAPFQNLNGASSSSSLFDLNQIPCDFEANYSQFQWSSSSFLGDSEMKIPRFSEPCSSLEYNPPNPNSQSSPCKGRKRRAVQERKRKGLGFKKPKAVSFSWIGKEAPEWLVQMMRDMNVDEDPKLVCEKVLSWTDVNPDMSRLLIPFKQLQGEGKDFLTPDEKRCIEGQGANNGKPGVRAILVNQMSSKEWNLNLKIWEMKKDSGKGTFNYVLNCGWNDFVQANGLEEDHTISLWYFRCNGILYFALVRPPPPPTMP